MKKLRKNSYSPDKQTIWNLYFPIIAFNNATFEAIITHIIELFNIEYRGTYGFYLKSEKNKNGSLKIIEYFFPKNNTISYINLAAIMHINLSIIIYTSYNNFKWISEDIITDHHDLIYHLRRIIMNYFPRFYSPYFFPEFENIQQIELENLPNRIRTKINPKRK